MLGLNERNVRVIAPFVGGGFGPKIMMFYPEEVLLPWVSMKLNRPVKWIEDRLEHFFATTHERGQIHDAEIALSRDGKILGIKDVFLHDGGAYDPYGLTVPINSQCTLLGPYVVPNYDSTFTQVFTNLTLVTPLSRRGTPARRVRHGTPARFRRARTQHRSRRNPPAQSHSGGRVPVQERDHLSGFPAARI
ncbi:MAG: molybdopterin cofactor-binding domain-containing protein [Bradyrhizobium sp.]